MELAATDPRLALLAVYDGALPQVYGYLVARCGRREVAEELTSETFLAAADAVRRTPAPRVGLPWLIGVARHKLVDHWRRAARNPRNGPKEELRPVLQQARRSVPWLVRRGSSQAR